MTRMTLAQRVQQRRETVKQRLGVRVNVAALLAHDRDEAMRNAHYRALHWWMVQDPRFDHQDDREPAE